MLDERKRRVLHALTEDYIQTAEPVGSRNLARKYNLGVSPATIRNEMADLEDEGYLHQPHTSAGRIPSDKGYRYYVDELMARWEPSPAERSAVYREVLAVRRAMEEMVHEAARLLARATQYASVVAAPSLEASIFRRLDLVPLDDLRVVAVVVADPGFVQHRIVEVGRPVSQAQCDQMAARLNRRLFGVRYGDIRRDLLAGIKEEVGHPELYDAVADLLTTGLSDRKSDKVYLEGTLNILNQPEFRDIERARSLLALLEARDILNEVLSVAARGGGTTVIIGHENPVAGLRECSVVSSAYRLGDEVIGVIGVLGPTRMDYSRAVGMVEYVADQLTEALDALMRGH
ncbi:MAG TPA: heat-inducible transcriptional repressor HrcA [Limnochordales bacterium]|nr:heat-inducible transcriptional repressor HrcA [Limnochordales bacterium]